MTIPKSELQHYQQAEDAELRAAAAEQEQRERFQATIRAQCADGEARHPEVWAFLEEETEPRAELPRLMRPGIAFGPAEILAYRMGQRSIVQWHRDNAHLAREGGPDDAAGAADIPRETE